MHVTRRFHVRRAAALAVPIQWMPTAPLLFSTSYGFQTQPMGMSRVSMLRDSNKLLPFLNKIQRSAFELIINTWIQDSPHPHMGGWGGIRSALFPAKAKQWLFAWCNNTLDTSRLTALVRNRLTTPFESSETRKVTGLHLRQSKSFPET